MSSILVAKVNKALLDMTGFNLPEAKINPALIILLSLIAE